MRTPLLPIPLLLLALGLAGCSCSDSHVRDEDAATSHDAATLRDAATTRDAATPDDTGLEEECALAGEVVCYGQAPVAGDPFPIEVSIAPTLDGSGCYCGQDLVTSATVEPGIVGLSSRLCPPYGFCAACFPPPISTLTFTPTQAGRTTVSVNGHQAFAVTVAPEGAVSEPLPTCVTAAPPDDCALVRELEEFASDRVCYRPTVTPGTRVAIRVDDPCGGCSPIGPCTVSVNEGQIFVEPSVTINACDHICPPVCVEQEHLCVTPPLFEGTYTVNVRGLHFTGDEPLPTLTVGEGDPAPVACFGSRRDP